MGISSYTAAELYDWVFNAGEDFLLVDVRNDVEFGKFKVEGPYLKHVLNVPYMEFVEFEEESLKKVPRDRKIKIVCAREGSAKYVAEILNNSGIEDIGYLTGGIGTWGDLLKPVRIEKNDRFELSPAPDKNRIEAYESQEQQSDSSSDWKIIVLGIAQDAGYPQAGCKKSCCQAYWSGNRKKQF